MSEDIDDLDVDEAETSELLSAAQEVVQLATAKAKTISPKHIVASCLAIIETAHASLLSAAVLAQYGVGAEDELEYALEIGKRHLRHFAQCFTENGVRMIKAGELPPEMVAAMPALVPEEPT